MSIDEKLLKAACVAYDDNSCGEESVDDTGMWAAIEAYEAAKQGTTDRVLSKPSLRAAAKILHENFDSNFTWEGGVDNFRFIEAAHNLFKGLGIDYVD